jgi:TolB-like protein
MRHISLGILGRVMAVSIFCAAGPALGADSVISTGKLLVLPFSAINQSEYQPWLGRSIQQSVISDLIASAPGRIVSSDTPAADDAAALEAARKAQVQYVIHGEFASVGGDVRITGQVLDVTSGKPITAIKATGPSSNVFAMEDDLTAQIRRRLSLTPPIRDGQPPVTDNPPAMDGVGVRAPEQPVDPYAQTYVAPAQGNNPPTQIEYNYYYSDPTDTYYPAPTWGWPGSSWGYGVSYVVPDYRYHHRWNHFSTSSNNRWNHSYAYGSANSVSGVPIGTGVSTLHAPGTFSISGSGVRGLGAASGRSIGGSGAAVHASPPAHVSTSRGPTVHMSTGFGFHAGTAGAHR